MKLSQKRAIWYSYREQEIKSQTYLLTTNVLVAIDGRPISNRDFTAYTLFQKQKRYKTMTGFVNWFMKNVETLPINYFILSLKQVKYLKIFNVYLESFGLGPERK